jgi:hypothetical protein
VEWNYNASARRGLGGGYIRIIMLYRDSVENGNYFDRNYNGTGEGIYHKNYNVE